MEDSATVLELPVDRVLPDVRTALRDGRSLVVRAEPGAGKTTRVPPALLEVVQGEVVVLEPRRLAARLAARRVAEERGEAPGETVGWQVRFEDVGGPRTRLRFVTEAILVRRMLEDPSLRGVGAVVLDEFHERHLHGDLALALAARLQAGARPDLRIVVMSATLDDAPVVRFLGGCPSLHAEGRRFPVEIAHADMPDDRPLEAQVANAVRRLAQEGLGGDVLVFLPGAAEIARARTACADIAARFGLELAVLHGDLPPAEQDRAVRPGERPKIVLSTNVAESSVTLPGVVAVVDSGLARVASHSPWNGLPALRLAKVSQASAAQRAGRAGRVRAGRCVRLYTKHDLETRPGYETPEIRRADLAETALLLAAAGVADLGAFGWFEAPEGAAVAAAGELLLRLGLVREGRLTESGRRAVRYPLHPRLARVMVEAEGRGVAELAAAAVAAIGERHERGEGRRPVSGRSDILEMMQKDSQAARQLARIARRGASRPAAGAAEEAVLECVLAGFPDRVAKRRKAGSSELLMCGGGSAELAPTSVVRDAELVVAVDVEERRTGTSRRTTVRIASAVEPEWLIDVAPDALREERAAEWNARGERVEMVARLRYGELVLDEKRTPPGADDAEAAAAVLLDAARARGPAAFGDAEALERILARLAFLARTFPEKPIAVPDADGALRALCAGRSSFAELREASLADAVRAALPPDEARLLAEMAPDRLTLPGGRGVKIHYQPEQAPWIASRLQDFFGMTRTPEIAGGREKLVIHLLAPNQRAVQVTTDLAGFWTRHYPQLRRELMRRYPKHKWPENPL